MHSFSNHVVYIYSQHVLVNIISFNLEVEYLEDDILSFCVAEPIIISLCKLFRPFAYCVLSL